MIVIIVAKATSIKSIEEMCG